MLQQTRLIIFLCLISGVPAYAGGAYPSVQLTGLLDLRLAYTDDTRSWLDDGLGKTRYGADFAGDATALARMAEASFLIMPRFSGALSAMLHLKYDHQQRYPLDVVEAFFSYRPVPRSDYRFKLLAGAFFPPISLEHEGLAWTSPYTITPSAINTWVGEELRALGTEATLAYAGEESSFSLGAAIFLANDPAGTLLAWRGWAMHDRKTAIFDRVPLPTLPIFEEGGMFSHQARWVEPVHEIDDNPAYYLNATWSYLDVATLKALYYYTGYNMWGFDGEQYAWQNRFLSLGARIFLPHDTELLAQYMQGSTQMGIGDPVDVSYKAWYLMLSKTFGKHRLSLRYDAFETIDRDRFVHYDNNNEDGDAWTLAYSYAFPRKQQIIFEVLRISSERPVRESVGEPAQADETQWQAAYRISF